MQSHQKKQRHLFPLAAILENRRVTPFHCRYGVSHTSCGHNSKWAFFWVVTLFFQECDMLHGPLCNNMSMVLRKSVNLISELLNTAHSCGRHGPVTAWFSSARPGYAISVPKTSTLGGGRSSLSTLMKLRPNVLVTQRNVWSCVLRGSPQSS
jgi:hypothetical protein